MQIVAREYSFHPIREYLNELAWDKYRASTIGLRSILGADPSEYARAVGCEVA